MGGLKHAGPLDAQPGQFVDIEKPPPVDVVGSRAPTGQPIRLTFEQGMQAFQAAGVARIETRQLLFNGGQHRRSGTERGQLRMQRRRALPWVGQRMQRGKSFAKKLQVGLAADVQQEAIIQRANREVVMAVLGVEAALLRVVTQGQFPGF